jgi:hypothetical protein
MDDDDLENYQFLLTKIGPKIGNDLSIKELIDMYTNLYSATGKLKSSHSRKKLINLSLYPYLSPDTIGNTTIAESIIPIQRFKNSLKFLMYESTLSWYDSYVYYILSSFRAIIDTIIEDIRDTHNVTDMQSFLANL